MLTAPLPVSPSLKLYLDSAELPVMKEWLERPEIRGVTTNPTLARKAGVTDYLTFCTEAARLAGARPISFEVFADDFAEMQRQARVLAAIAPNVYVKVPVTDTEGRPTTEVVRALSHSGVKVNVTAVFTVSQASELVRALTGGAPSIVSMFAGRIADAGVDPVPLVSGVVHLARESSDTIEVLWASPREILNVRHAEQANCHIITVTPELLKKLSTFGKPLKQYSLETVRMLTGDALASRFTL
jgi:transaldolase